jgi:hypothetical protein
MRATRWEPLELSLVAVAADPGAGIRARTHAVSLHDQEASDGDESPASGRPPGASRPRGR